MSLFGLFGRDKNPAGNPIINLPKAPPVVPQGNGMPSLPQILKGGWEADTAMSNNSLPSAPPAARKKAGAFDDDNYQQTMLALAAGFFGANNFGEGLGNAAKAIYGQNDAIRKEGRPQLGGPDNSFEVYTDPQTGEHTFKPIQAAVDYQNRKRVKQKDVADIHGRIMTAISQLPAEEQQAAYADVLANPDYYGADPEALPQTWSPTYGRVLGDMGMTVSQALTRKQAAEAEGNREKHRTVADEQREKRLGIYSERSEALTNQGEARIGIAREALSRRGSGGGGKGGRKGKTPISSMSDADLLSIALGK